MSPPPRHDEPDDGYRWLRLELGTPVDPAGDARLLINGTPVTAGEFHDALEALDRAVFVFAAVNQLAKTSPP